MSSERHHTLQKRSRHGTFRVLAIRFEHIQSSNAGVTLLELLLVISLLAIVASMTYPLLSGPLRQSHISSATWAVATALEQARSRGLMDLVVPIATFTCGSGRYEIGSQSYIMDNQCQISWPGGINGTQRAFIFDSLGQATAPSFVGPPSPQILNTLAPLVGGSGTITIATSGLITWVTAP